MNLRRVIRIVLTCAVGLASPFAAADRVLLLIDNSGSMRTNDASRLVPAAVSGFIATLPAGTEVGVIAFDARAQVVQPLIAAEDFAPAVLDRIDYSGQFTDPSVAVERALYEFRQLAPEADDSQSVVLITDGVIDLGNPTASLRAEDWLVGELSTSLQRSGTRVWAIALTDDADYRMLSRLTSATDGDYYRAMQASDVATAIDRIQSGIRSRIEAETETARDSAIAGTRQASTPIAASPRPEAVSAAASMPAAAAVEPTATERTSRAATTAALAASAPTRFADGSASDASPREPTPSMPAPPATAPATSTLRWWLAFALLASGILMLAWVSYGTWRSRRSERTESEPALEYFPECYLVDLQGVTEKPTHMLSSKYNMITRLQNPPADGINYVQLFRRQIGRRHALIEYRDFSFWVTDQNSVNGTFLNGERLSGESRLKHGDRLRFHSFEFEFCVSDLALSNETLVDRERAPAY